VVRTAHRAHCAQGDRPQTADCPAHGGATARGSRHNEWLGVAWTWCLLRGAWRFCGRYRMFDKV